MITAAALIMAISFAALTSADVSFMRMFGLGLTIAVLVDAAVVRMILVPGVHVPHGPVELVGARAVGAPARAHRHRRIRKPALTARSATDSARLSSRESRWTPATCDPPDTTLNKRPADYRETTVTLDICRNDE
ncbi:MMPL family transporter [Mycobacterium innocens]|uniref:MMPL family transporter n=1 Tax=Mycobacterium innocens TaxID=2341083 RepID=UPI001FC93022|nr:MULTISPECIES: MMPL family transporter [Mycobacterium]